MLHMPFVHAAIPWLLLQAFPHIPQLFGSLARLAQYGIAGPPSAPGPLHSE
jgi:hypothetical protein